MPALAPAPLLTHDVDLEPHARVLPILGVGLGRAEMLELADEIRNTGSMAYGEWWAKVGKAKAVLQWQTKFLPLWAPANLIKNQSVELLGELLFKDLSAAGSFSTEVLPQPEVPT